MPPPQGPVPEVVDAKLLGRLNDGQVVASDAGPTVPGVSTDEKARKYTNEMVWACIKGTLESNKLLTAVKAAGLTKKQHAEMMMDCLWMAWLELDGADEEVRERLVAGAKSLRGDPELYPRQVFMENLDIDLMEEVGFIVSQATWKAKESKVNTRNVYKQHKYNLFREESEGYGKLITELERTGKGALSHANVSKVGRNILSLIGYFSLDPNRVFDVVLEAFEMQSDNLAFLDLLKMFRTSYATHLLGFKFRHYQQVDDKTPLSLYKLSAVLIKHNIVDLDATLAHLAPSDADAKAQQRASVERRMVMVNNIGRVNLAATGPDAARDKERKEAEEREDNRKKELLELDYLANNQKLGLIQGFLAIGDWEHAKLLLERYASIAPAQYPPISLVLGQAILGGITKAYAALYPGGVDISLSSKGRDSYPRESLLPSHVLDMIAVLGYHLGRDVLLFTKVCRVLREHVRVAMHLGDSIERAEQVAAGEKVIQRAILPGLMLIHANPAASSEVWEVLRLLPYTARFRLYSSWKACATDQTAPQLMAAARMAEIEVKKVMRRISKDKDVLKVFSRTFGKLAPANPLVVLGTVVQQIEAYDNMIVVVVDAFKYLTAMGYDVLTYLVIDRMSSGGREKLKGDGINVSDWLQSLAVFCGHLCKKYGSIEITALVQYITNQLKDRSGIDLIVLKELICRMGGIESIEDLGETELPAMGGGEVLRSEATTYVQKNNKALKKGQLRLRDALVVGPKCDHLAGVLLVLAAQQKSLIAFDSDVDKPLKFVGELYDKCQNTLVQYVDFLEQAFTPEEYAGLVPSLRDLHAKHGLEPEAIFAIYRPLLRNLTQPPPKAEESDAVAVKVGPVTLTWKQLIADVRGILTPRVWECISPEVYILFWSHALYDIHVPKERYRQELDKKKAELRQIEEAAQVNTWDRAADKEAAAHRRKEKERLGGLIDALTKELDVQEKHVESVTKKLQGCKDRWFAGALHKKECVSMFWQHCVLPRAVFSPVDAIYCDKFVQKVHTLRTPFFSTLQYYDTIMRNLAQLIFARTEHEASRMGLYLAATLRVLLGWKADSETYEQECAGTPGFNLSFSDQGEKKTASLDEFLKVSVKWQHRLTRCFMTLLKSKEHMEVRNALIVLHKMVDVFPQISRLSKHIEKDIEAIKDGDGREDLRIMSTSYLIRLRQQKARFVSEDQFKWNPSHGAYVPTAEAAAKEDKDRKADSASAASRGPGKVAAAAGGGREGKPSLEAEVARARQEAGGRRDFGRDEKLERGGAGERSRDERAERGGRGDAGGGRDLSRAAPLDSRGGVDREPIGKEESRKRGREDERGGRDLGSRPPLPGSSSNLAKDARDLGRPPPLDSARGRDREAEREGRGAASRGPSPSVGSRGEESMGDAAPVRDAKRSRREEPAAGGEVEAAAAVAGGGSKRSRREDKDEGGARDDGGRGGAGRGGSHGGRSDKDAVEPPPERAERADRPSDKDKDKDKDKGAADKEERRRERKEKDKEREVKEEKKEKKEKKDKKDKGDREHKDKEHKVKKEDAGGAGKGGEEGGDGGSGSKRRKLDRGGRRLGGLRRPQRPGLRGRR